MQVPLPGSVLEESEQFQTSLETSLGVRKLRATGTCATTHHQPRWAQSSPLGRERKLRHSLNAFPKIIEPQPGYLPWHL